MTLETYCKAAVSYDLYFVYLAIYSITTFKIIENESYNFLSLRVHQVTLQWDSEKKENFFIGITAKFP